MSQATDRKVVLDEISAKRYTVVEERQGNTTLFPHTRQLPEILSMANRKFKDPMPPRLARVDHRAKQFFKIVLREAALMFCNFYTGNRDGGVLFFPIYDANFVTHLAVVQQVTESTTQGLLHYFKFYTGPSFHQEIYLSGRRLYFTQHSIERFAQRVQQPYAKCFSNLLAKFYLRPMIAMECNGSHAFVVFVDYSSASRASLLAFPFIDKGDSIVVLTCLSIQEIDLMERTLPVHTFNFHYDRHDWQVKFRNQNPRRATEDFIRQWENRVQQPALNHVHKEVTAIRWEDKVHTIFDGVRSMGLDENSILEFCDGVYGPCALRIRSERSRSRYDELEDYKKVCPAYAWEEILAKRYAASYRLSDAVKFCIRYEKPADVEDYYGPGSLRRTDEDFGREVDDVLADESCNEDDDDQFVDDPKDLLSGFYEPKKQKPSA